MIDDSACLILNSTIFWQFFKDHSSEKRGLRSTFLSSEMLQNLLYSSKKKTHVVFHLEQL